MPDHERAMLAYVKLADLSHRKRQMIGRDKFLLLAAAAACRAGWPEIANRCQVFVLENNPSHLIGRWELFTDAMRDEDFAVFLRRLERFCSYEKAEHLLAELGLEPDVPEGDQRSPGEFATDLLADWER